MRWRLNDHLIPLERGQAVGAGWPYGEPLGVTWHWTATDTLEQCRRLLGGPDARRKGVASAHFAVGRSRAEGVDRYVTLEDRSWHAGRGQLALPDGRPLAHPDQKAARRTIGVETVHLGFARPGVAPEAGWLRADAPQGHATLWIQPWGEEQVEMMVEVGRAIAERWPGIGPRNHHGHHDLCPGYKLDVVGFPFARVLRAIYRDAEIPDLWSPVWRVSGRQRVLAALGLYRGRIDGLWGEQSREALRRLQQDAGHALTGAWSTATSWRAFDLLTATGTEWSEVFP